MRRETQRFQLTQLGIAALREPYEESSAQLTDGFTEGCSLGRRRLTIASGIFQGCTSNWGIREPFRAAALNWTPSQSAYFDSVNFGWNCARKDVLDRVYLMLALAQPGS